MENTGNAEDSVIIGSGNTNNAADSMTVGYGNLNQDDADGSEVFGREKHQ